MLSFGQPTIPVNFHPCGNLSQYCESFWFLRKTGNQGFVWDLANIKVDTNITKMKWKQVCQVSVAQSGVLHFWDLMPDDLRLSWCNDNRNQVHNKCNVVESSWNHPSGPAHGKIVFHKTDPWCQKGWGPLGPGLCVISLLVLASLSFPIAFINWDWFSKPLGWNLSDSIVETCILSSVGSG